MPKPDSVGIDGNGAAVNAHIPISIVRHEHLIGGWLVNGTTEQFPCGITNLMVGQCPAGRSDRIELDAQRVKAHVITGPTNPTPDEAWSRRERSQRNLRARDPVSGLLRVHAISSDDEHAPEYGRDDATDHDGPRSPTLRDVASRNPNPKPTRLQKASAPLLLKLSALPRWLVPLMLGALLLLGFFLDGVLGSLALMLVGLFLAWLVMLSWPLLSPGSKMIRTLIVGVVLGVAISDLLSA
jgi:hypothetical protein